MTIDRNYNAVFEKRVDFPFWEGLHRGEIRIQRCSGCKRWLWPAEWRCGDCGSWDFEWSAVPGEGRVYAWERTHYPFVKAFQDLLPYVNVLVEIPAAGGARVMGLLVEPSDGIAVGSEVIAEIQVPSERTRNMPAIFWRLAAQTKTETEA